MLRVFIDVFMYWWQSPLFVMLRLHRLQFECVEVGGCMLMRTNELLLCVWFSVLNSGHNNISFFRKKNALLPLDSAVLTNCNEDVEFLCKPELYDNAQMRFLVATCDIFLYDTGFPQLASSQWCQCELLRSHHNYRKTMKQWANLIWLWQTGST